MRNKFIAALTALLLLVAGLFTAQAAQAETNEPGTSPDNPIILGDPDEAPESAETDGPYMNQCATEQTWVLAREHDEFQYSRTIPAVQEESHPEYRWKVYNRTYDPGQEEISHLDYLYKQPVFTTEYEYIKQVKGKVQMDIDPGRGRFWINVDNFGWETWVGNSTQWSSNNVAVLESGSHGAVQAEWSEGGIDFRKWTTRYQYVPTGGDRPTQTGWTEPEVSHEVRGDPWVQVGEPTKHVTQAYVAPSFTGWAFAGYTDWQTSPEAPADPDGEAGEDNPLNLVQLGSRLSKVVVTTEARPAYTEYFVLGGEPSRDPDDASWVTEDQAPGEGWEEFDERSVDDAPIYYFWTDGVECPEPYTEERTTSSATTTCEATVTITQDWTREWTLGEDLELHPGEWVADGDPVSTSAAPTAAEIQAAGLVCTPAGGAKPVIANPNFTG